MIAILSSSYITPENKQRLVRLLQINNCDFTQFKDITDKWLKSKNFRFLKALADLDSSL